MVLYVLAPLIVLAIALSARWVRDRCSDLDRNLFGPVASAPPGSPS